MCITDYRIWIKFICKECKRELIFCDDFRVDCECGRSVVLNITPIREAHDE